MTYIHINNMYNSLIIYIYIYYTNLKPAGMPRHWWWWLIRLCWILAWETQGIQRITTTRPSRPLGRILAILPFGVLSKTHENTWKNLTHKATVASCLPCRFCCQERWSIVTGNWRVESTPSAIGGWPDQEIEVPSEMAAYQGNEIQSLSYWHLRMRCLKNQRMQSDPITPMQCVSWTLNKTNGWLCMYLCLAVSFGACTNVKGRPFGIYLKRDADTGVTVVKRTKPQKRSAEIQKLWSLGIQKLWKTWASLHESTCNDATMFILTHPPSPWIQTNPHQEPLTNFHWLCTIPETVNAPAFQRGTGTVGQQKWTSAAWVARNHQIWMFPTPFEWNGPLNSFEPISTLLLFAPVFPNQVFHDCGSISISAHFCSYLIIGRCNHPLFSTRSTCSLPRPVGHLYCGPKPKPWQTALPKGA